MTSICHDDKFADAAAVVYDSACVCECDAFDFIWFFFLALSASLSLAVPPGMVQKR